MPQLPILTTEFTRQLERHIAPDADKPPANCEMRRFGQTVARKVRGGWPASGVFCFNGEDVGRLDEILKFFGSVDPLFYLVHGGYTPSVGRALHSAGFFPGEWKQTILYGLPAAEAVAPPAGVTVETVDAGSIEQAAQVAAEGNGWDPAWREGAKAGIRQTLGRPGITMFLARFEGEPAGVGNLSATHADVRWCGVGGGAVVPRFRGKGIQTALLLHRLHVAYQRGLELVIGGADFGTASFRNQQRVRLRLGYIEAIWKRG